MFFDQRKHAPNDYMKNLNPLEEKSLLMGKHNSLWEMNILEMQSSSEFEKTAMAIQKMKIMISRLLVKMQAKLGKLRVIFGFYFQGIPTRYFSLAPNHHLNERD